VWLLRDGAEIERITMGGEDFSLQCMRVVRTGPDAPSPVSADENRSEEEEKDMARRKLTEQEMLKGVEKALASKKCPPQLKAGLQMRADALRKQLGLEPKIRRSVLFGIVGG
jgi:hypothetical protein